MSSIVIVPRNFDKSKKGLGDLRSLNMDLVFNESQRTLEPAETRQFIIESNPTIAIAGTEKYDVELLSACPSLKIISRMGAGIDSIDLIECAKRKIEVRNAPKAPSNAVAELTVGLIICALRRVREMSVSLYRQTWETFIGKELSEASIGIIGCGNIGSKVAEKMVSLGAKEVRVNDSSYRKTKRAGENYIPSDKEQIFEHCDVISVHVPLREGNRDLITKKELSMIKKDAIIVNMSRGGIVNEADLFDWLKENKEAYAIIDTFENEPYDGALVTLANALLTPHMADCSFSAKQQMQKEAIENIIDFFKQNDRYK